MNMGEGWNHVVRGGLVVKSNTPSPPNPQLVTEAPKPPNVRATRKTAKPKKLVPKSTAATKAATVKPNKKAPASVKPASAKPTNLMVTPQHPSSALEDISDLLDNLPLQACVELSLRRLIFIPSLFPGVARTRAVLTIVILFLAEYGSTP
jgi:hypothetical protein